MEERAFAGRMTLLKGAFLAGLALTILPGALLLSLPGLVGDRTEPVIAATVFGFVLLAVAGHARGSAKCIKCGKVFCGDTEDSASGSMNVLAGTCKSCGYRLP